MFSIRGYNDPTKSRYAEETDARLKIRRRVNDSERRGSQKSKPSSETHEESDEAFISDEDLESFFGQFIRTVNTQDIPKLFGEMVFPIKNKASKNTEPRNTINVKKQSKPVSAERRARAIGAYQKTSNNV